MKTESINKIINKKSIKKPKLLVENLLPADGITILAGEPKVGKTFLLQQLTYSISVENTFLGRNVEKTKVIYFSTENSIELLKDRLLNLGTNFGNSLYCYQCPMSIDDIKYALATMKRKKNERILAIDVGKYNDELEKNIDKLLFKNNIFKKILKFVSYFLPCHIQNKLNQWVGIDEMGEVSENEINNNIFQYVEEIEEQDNIEESEEI